MGMENFRIDLFWKSNASINQIIECIQTEFKVEPHHYTYRKLFNTKTYYCENEFRIEGYVVAYFYEEDKYLSLSACFSNYEHYLSVIYRIYCLLQKNHNANINLGKVVIESQVEYYKFKEEIESFYKVKHNQFIQKYNIKDVNMLGGSDFYLKIKKIMKKHQV